MDKLEILRPALSSREEEILEYQVNIDNYTRAIDRINENHSDDPAMIEFRDVLAGMLKTSKIEQLKAIIIRDVIAEQITELEAS